MSSIPKVNKPKYNKDDKFTWVDSQWEKFLTEQKDLKVEISEKDKVIEQLRKDLVTCNLHFQKRKNKIEDLENEVEQLKQDFYFDMRNKNLEIKKLKEESKDG